MHTKIFKMDQRKRANWEQSKWICLSSLLFLIPAYYSYRIRYYHYSFILILITIVSINYWRNPLYSLRRTMDYILAVSFNIWITLLAVIYIREPILFVSFWGIYCVLIYCNHMSGVFLDKEDENWWKYHVICHFCEIYGLCVTLYCLPLLETVLVVL